MKYIRYSYGVMLCVLIGSAAIFLLRYIPFGAVAISIILGIAIGNIVHISEVFKTGIGFAEKHLLSLAIAFMGVNLDFLVLKEIGLKSVALVIVALIVTIFSAVVIGRLLKFDKKMSLLLGIGNGVCGSSAIAATQQIIRADEEEVGLSVAVVNFLGTLGIFLIPFIAKFIFKFSDINAGILVGNTLQAVGQVVAAGFSISDFAGQTATIIKMTRILMLLPLVFVLIFLNKNDTRASNFKTPKVPIFIAGFIFFSVLSTFNVLSTAQVEIVAQLSHCLLVVAMAGIGLKIKVSSILKDGKKALIIAGAVFFIQILFSSVALFVFY